SVWRDELITALRVRPDIGRVFRGVAQSRPDLADREVQPLVEVDERVVAPDGLTQVLARHDLAAVLDQDGEDLGGLRLEPDDVAVLTQLARRRVEREGTERGFHYRPGNAAITSISSISSGRASFTTCTSVLAGVVSPKYRARTSRTAWALSMSVMNVFIL